MIKTPKTERRTGDKTNKQTCSAREREKERKNGKIVANNKTQLIAMHTHAQTHA